MRETDTTHVEREAANDDVCVSNATRRAHKEKRLMSQHKAGRREGDLNKRRQEELS